MYIRNLLDANTSRFLSTSLTNVGNWFTETANGTLTRTTKRSHSGVASALFTYVGSNGGTGRFQSGQYNSGLNIDTVTELVVQAPISGQHVYRAIVWFHHEYPGREIRVGIQFFDDEKSEITYTSDHYVTLSMGFREWSLAIVDVDVPSNAAFGVIRIDIPSIDTTDPVDKYLWIDDAALIQQVDIRNSEFVEKVSRWVPEFILEQDDVQEFPNYPLRSFLEVAGGELDEIQQMILEFGYGTVGDSTLPTASSTLVDPTNYPENGTRAEWLPWLAQLVGLRPSSVAEGLDAGAWSVLEADYPTWDDWEDGINPVAGPSAISITSISRDASGYVTVTKSNHGLEVGQVVDIAGVTPTSFNGYYEITSTTTNTFIYEQLSLTTASGSGGTYQVAADLSWAELDNLGSTDLSRPQALAEFIRTGASGIQAGTIEGMRRAARIPLDGFDVRAEIIRADGIITVATPESSIEVSVGQDVEIYGCPDPSMNRIYEVASVFSNGTGFTAASGGSVTEPMRGFATNKVVTLTRGQWAGSIDSIELTSNQIIALLTEPVPVFAPSAPVIIAGTGNGVLDATHNPVSVTLSADRKTVTFSKVNTNISPIDPVNATLRLTADRNCFYIATQSSQTPRAGVVTEYASLAKPAGGVVTEGLI